MKIKRLIRGELCANGYIVYDEASFEAYIIDPGYDKNSYVEAVDKLGLSLKGILLTHHHYDHVDAAKDLSKEMGVPIFISEADRDMLKFPADGYLKDGEIISFGQTSLELVNTPGHTKGSSCFVNHKDKLAFTGDTIFNVDLGRTDFIDGSEDQLIASIKNIISKWEDDFTIYPGHGDSATMEYVRKYNSEYIDIMNGRNRQ